MRLHERVSLVTGAGGGLGRAIAERFAREGAVVVVNDVDPVSAAETVDACRAIGATSEAMEASVADSAAVDEMVNSIAARFGRLDVLVNNAGVSTMTDPSTRESARPDIEINSISDESWRRMIGVHLDGTFFCTRAVVPIMADAGAGSIVCISSIAGTAGWGPLHYSAAKGGILGLVRSLARTVGPLGIRVNAICPGAIDAGMTRLRPPEMIGQSIPQIPLRRLGSADDIGAAAAYLASDDAAYMTGQAISPNGGLIIS